MDLPSGCDRTPASHDRSIAHGTLGQVSYTYPPRLPGAHHLLLQALSVDALACRRCSRRERTAPMAALAFPAVRKVRNAMLRPRPAAAIDRRGLARSDHGALIGCDAVDRTRGRTLILRRVMLRRHQGARINPCALLRGHGGARIVRKGMLRPLRSAPDHRGGLWRPPRSAPRVWRGLARVEQTTPIVRGRRSDGQHPGPKDRRSLVTRRPAALWLARESGPWPSRQDCRRGPRQKPPRDCLIRRPSVPSSTVSDPTR